MTVEEQLITMRSQLGEIRSVADKAAYIYFMFDPDPEFCLVARTIIKRDIADTIVRKV